MAVAWYWARTELRGRWRAWLSIAVLVGVGGGLAMASLAAARRTDTAYPRFLEQARAPDFVLDPDVGVDGSEFLDAVAALPGVAHRSDAQAMALGAVVDGQIAIAELGSSIASVDGQRFYERDRVHLVEGRMPDPSRPDEVLVSHSAAAEGIAVGDRIRYAAVDVGGMFEALERGEPGIPVGDALVSIDVEVTGIGIFPELAVAEEALVPDVMMLTPALFDTLPEESRLWSRPGVHLLPGADAGAVKLGVRDLAAAAGGEVFFEDRAVIADRAKRAVRPYVLALSGLGLAGALFVALLATQLVRRTLGQADADRRMLMALSAGRRAVRAGSVLPALVAAGVALFVALLVQAIVSRWTPIGPVATIEPAPGVHVDWAIGLPGSVLLVAVGVLPAVASGGRSVAGRPALSTLAMRAAQAGASLPVVLGISQALGHGDRGRRAAARSGLASVAVAVTMLVAVVTFATSLTHLVDNPEVHGWNADVGLLGAGGYGSFDVQAAAEVDGVESLSAGTFATVGSRTNPSPGWGWSRSSATSCPPCSTDGHRPVPERSPSAGGRWGRSRHPSATWST